jgi:iron complex transport system ATP-binding protein
VTLELAGVSVTYPGCEAPALDDIDLVFKPGTHTAILGPNGAGKSTLLRVLAGLVACDEGNANLEGQPSNAWSRRDFARRVAFVSSAEESPFPVRVRDYVMLGRNPYLDGWRSPSEADGGTVSLALQRTDLTFLADRYVGSLSAGELQRARIARALAQESSILLLDEPTAHLDVGHEFAAFELLAQLVTKLSLMIVSVTHNMNMASRFCDRVVLITGGRVVADGDPESVLTSGNLARAFDWPVETLHQPGLGILAVPVSRRSDA